MGSGGVWHGRVRRGTVWLGTVGFGEVSFVGTVLEVDGVVIADLWRYSLRWRSDGTAHVPVLYHEGRRVTKPWRLTLTADVPADETGASANTD